MTTNALTSTAFNWPGQVSVYKGKVRDVYNINNQYLVMVATDRISAFDVVLPKGIPFKGQVLNQIASHFLDMSAAIVPNWKIASPDPVVTIGKLCKPFAVEMVIRAYLTGSSWRNYKSGARNICGVELPDGLKEHQVFDAPIITPSTKAAEGHDMDISPAEIIDQQLMSADEFNTAANYTRALFDVGSKYAREKGLLLVDTKYEFGKDSNGQIVLIDEVHTPDSSRYFMADSYQRIFDEGGTQKQLSKEFVREWLMANGFQGLEGQQVPFMSHAFVSEVSERYIELFEKITGKAFQKADPHHAAERIDQNVRKWLAEHDQQN